MDNTTLIIENLALKHNSYIEAVKDFLEQYPEIDEDDIIKTVSPILVGKIRQEFIDKGYIPHLKKKNIYNFLNE